eukprot:35553_1
MTASFYTTATVIEVTLPTHQSNYLLITIYGDAMKYTWQTIEYILNVLIIVIISTYYLSLHYIGDKYITVIVTIFIINRNITKCYYHCIIYST